MRAPIRAQAGFTITELMIVVAIVGVIAAIAAPNMGEMIRRQRVKTAAFDVYAGLTHARSEAIKRNVTVNVSPVSGDWAQGFVVIDVNNRTVRTQQGFNSITATGPSVITFNNSGRLTAGSTARISLVAADVASAEHGKRCVYVETTGRASTKEGAC
jgi:type IV fimbrial biogenesis protein FimT